MRCRFELVRFQPSGVDLATMVTVRAARGSADTGVICVVCRELGGWPANTRPIRHTDKRSRFIKHFRLVPPTVFSRAKQQARKFQAHVLFIAYGRGRRDLANRACPQSRKA